MALINEPANSYGHPQSAVEFSGARMCEVTRIITIATGDNNASVYLVAEVPDQAVLESITLEGAAITGGTSFDVGLYDEKGNVIGTGNQLASALDMSSVAGLPTGPAGSPIRQAMTAVGVANVTKKVLELAGHVNKAFPATGETQRRAKYRIGLKATTKGAGSGTLVARTTYMMAV